jgi:hypothetical protein
MWIDGSRVAGMGEILRKRKASRWRNLEAEGVDGKAGNREQGTGNRE